jgi:hypothetical protein
MAEPLAFRNRANHESTEDTYGESLAVDRYGSNLLTKVIQTGPNTNEYIDLDPLENSNNEDDNREDSRDEGLLIRSTISRDTTQNTPAVDLVGLSKLVTQRDNRPLNTEDSVSERFVPPGPPPPPPSSGKII